MKESAPILFSFSAGLAVYQIVFGLSLLAAPNTIVGASSWDWVTAVLPPYTMGVVFLLLAVGTISGIVKNHPYRIQQVVILQGLMWAWWATSFLLATFSGEGVASGTATYFLLGWLCRVVSRWIPDARDAV